MLILPRHHQDDANTHPGQYWQVTRLLLALYNTIYSLSFPYFRHLLPPLDRLLPASPALVSHTLAYIRPDTVGGLWLRCPRIQIDPGRSLRTHRHSLGWCRTRPRPKTWTELGLRHSLSPQIGHPEKC